VESHRHDVAPKIEDLLDPGGVPGHDDVGEQAQGIGNRLHLVEVFGLMTSDATRVDRALEGVDRFAPVEHAQQGKSENYCTR
jgi:hypothetical protein